MSNPNIQEQIQAHQDTITDCQNKIKKLQGQVNTAALAGIQPQQLTALASLPWKPSKFPKDDPKGEWVHFSEAPEWVKNIKFPVEDAGFKYYSSKNGNLTRYEI